MKLISPKPLLSNLFTAIRNGDIFANSSLDLPLARTKTLDPRITFTRASTGTYVGSDGLIKSATTNEPRFDHNPTTGESLGLLVEEARTNLLTYSELFNASPWAPGSLSVASTTETTSPAGNNTAVRFIENTVATQFHFINYAITKTASAIQYTVSTYAKDGGRELIFSAANGATGAVARFNLATGAITAPATGYGGGFTAQGSTITSAGNGWYRCSMTFTTDATTGITIQYALYNTALATNVYTGDGASGIYIWGAQLEAGAFATSYIPTTTATVTRAADVASITGSNFSSFYNQTEGTVFIDVNSAPIATVIQTAYDINDGTTNERIFTRRLAAGTIGTAITDNNTVQANIGGFAIAASARYRSSFAYKLNDFSGSVNGATNDTASSGTLPTVTAMNIGATQAGASQTNGTIRRLTYWPTRLANTTLQQITQP